MMCGPQGMMTCRRRRLLARAVCPSRASSSAWNATCSVRSGTAATASSAPASSAATARCSTMPRSRHCLLQGFLSMRRNPSRASRSTSSAPATAASWPCSIWAKTCSTLAERVELRAFRRGRAGGSRMPKWTSPSSKAASPRRRSSSASEHVRATQPLPGHHRRLRHRGRHPGAAQPARGRRVGGVRLRHARRHRHAGDGRRRSPATCKVDLELWGCPVNARQVLAV